MTRHAAIDLGASSGRVVVADVGPDRLALQEIHRFSNGPVQHDDGLHWDVSGLHREALAGLAMAGPVDSIGIDSWAVDYGLLDADGHLLNEPYCYRDARTDDVTLPLSRADLFARNGLQHLPFTTIYQLATEKALDQASSVLLIPDLIAYWLTGSLGCEITNASTTGLLDATTRRWSPELLAACGATASQLGPLVSPGEVRGSFDGTPVVAVGSHDTASAFVGAPLSSRSAVCISLGTWGLVGVELDAPVLTEAAFAANFTNELGVDGRVRFLRNVVGLWVLQESLREWGSADLAGLLAEAATLPAGPLVDLDDPSLLPPGGMPARVDALAGRALSPAELVRCVVDSLVAALARTVTEALSLTGLSAEVVHVVGGGSQNALLCQSLATTLGLPVLAGPVEATALGNALVQARSAGTVKGSLEDLRELVRRTHALTRYEP